MEKYLSDQQIKSQLKRFYLEQSKHAQYQVLPCELEFLAEDIQDKIVSRYERERLEYILKYIDVKNKNILDIGGNTGFFTFELNAAGAKKVVYQDCNKTHAQFVALSANYLKIYDKIEVVGHCYDFNESGVDATRFFDVILLLNVLHHFGDDFGDQTISMEKAKQEIIKHVNTLAKRCPLLVLQIGFNWKGDRNRCLFATGTKQEVIDFISEGTVGQWRIDKIGIAEMKNESIRYVDLNNKNIERIDALGEFLNRPIFILRSLKN